MNRIAGDIHVLAIVKGEEQYVFLYDADSKAEALRTMGRWASNPELSFSWYDAAVLGGLNVALRFVTDVPIGSK